MNVTLGFRNSTIIGLRRVLSLRNRFITCRLPGTLALKRPIRVKIEIQMKDFLSNSVGAFCNDKLELELIRQ